MALENAIGESVIMCSKRRQADLLLAKFYGFLTVSNILIYQDDRWGAHRKNCSGGAPCYSGKYGQGETAPVAHL